jgi:hypothetical protein
VNLENIVISNFRSIEYAEMNLSPRCRVLVGINESGKSNLLKALSSLGSFMPSGTDDVREPAPGEDQIAESLVQFSFSLDKDETAHVLTAVSKKIFAKNLNKVSVAIFKRKSLTLKDFIQLRNTGLYEVDVINQQKLGKYWTIDESFELAAGWSKPSKACPSDYRLTLKDGTTALLKTFSLVLTKDCPDISEWLQPAEIEDLSILVGTAVVAELKTRIPDVLLWEYSETNLLPGAVNLDEFASNPDSCLPLKNMFLLADIDDISGAISRARGGSRNTLHNFFAQIANKATSHFRNVWKEHRSIEFELMPDGDELIPGVREKNRFDFSKRSDGFKRFVSFLLLISAKVKSGNLSNTLLLIDEPDISLHPSGARFLRDELISISKANYVVYSTHSIFMIDREDIGRHVIVTKRNEKTKLSVADESNIVDEEVIFNAIGYSLFESLRQRNLIFEGWKDKHLFEIAIKRLPSTHSKIKKDFVDVGTCHARGVKDIRNITPLMELARRDCVVVSDGDAAAKEKQKEFIDGKGYGTWKRYDELLPSGTNVKTSEDFLIPSAFRTALISASQRHKLVELDENRLADSQGKLYVINEWLRSGGLSKEARELEVRRIKDTVSDNLSIGDIDDVYFVFLTALAEYLKSL